VGPGYIAKYGLPARRIATAYLNGGRYRKTLSVAFRRSSSSGSTRFLCIARHRVTTRSLERSSRSPCMTTTSYTFSGLARTKASKAKAAQGLLISSHSTNQTC